jgi:hypothetical protein
MMPVSSHFLTHELQRIQQSAFDRIEVPGSGRSVSKLRVFTGNEPTDAHNLFSHKQSHQIRAQTRRHIFSFEEERRTPGRTQNAPTNFYKLTDGKCF